MNWKQIIFTTIITLIVTIYTGLKIKYYYKLRQVVDLALKKIYEFKY